MRNLTRRAFNTSAASAALLAAAPRAHAQSAADKKTLRFIAQSDLRVLDPIWTTAYISRNHGYMIYDTLFAIDAEFAPHPQMVGDFTISDDKLAYHFTLRDGLGFHDGSPVRGADCVASLKRWMVRDSHGQSLALALDEIKTDGDKSFSIKLKEPFSLLIDALAKVSSLAPFMMPERLANTDPFTQITDTVGSGPFKFVKDEFQPGHQVVYVKNTDYVPRNEPPSWASGGKVVKVDRVEWLYIPDAMTKAAALQRRRGRLVGKPAERCAAGADRQFRYRRAAGRCPSRADHGQVQPPAAALRQSEDAAGGHGGRRSGGFPHRAGRR